MGQLHSIGSWLVQYVPNLYLPRQEQLKGHHDSIISTVPEVFTEAPRGSLIIIICNFLVSLSGILIGSIN